MKLSVIARRIFRVLPCYANKFKQNILQTNFQNNDCTKVFKNINLTQTHAANVEKETKQQAIRQSTFNFRQGCLTASVTKDAVHMRNCLPYGLLTKFVIQVMVTLLLQNRVTKIRILQEKSIIKLQGKIIRVLLLNDQGFLFILTIPILLVPLMQLSHVCVVEKVA